MPTPQAEILVSCWVLYRDHTWSYERLYVVIELHLVGNCDLGQTVTTHYNTKIGSTLIDRVFVDEWRVRSTTPLDMR